MSEQELAAVFLSLKVAGLGVVFGLPFAVICAFALARCDFWGKSILNVLVHLPLVMPPVVTGYILLLVFARNGLIGGFLEQAFGLVFAFRWTGAVLAAVVMSFPLMVRPIRLSFETLDPLQQAAAKTLGANGFLVFLTISLPLALPGILAGAVLGFAKALGEFGATITFVSNIPGETRTLSLSIYSALQTPFGETEALRLAFISLLLSIGALGLSEWLVRRASKHNTTQGCYV